MTSRLGVADGICIYTRTHGIRAPSGASHGIGTHLIPLDFFVWVFLWSRGNNLRRAGVREWAGEEASTGLSRALLSLGKHCNLVWACFPSLATSHHIAHLMMTRWRGEHGNLLLESDRKREKRSRSLGMRRAGKATGGSFRMHW